MTNVSQESAVNARQQPQWAEFLKLREMWASLAIGMMWLAVLFDAVYGPSFVSTNGGTSTTIPSAIVVALFAWLGSRSVAKYCLGGGRA